MRLLRETRPGLPPAPGYTIHVVVILVVVAVAVIIVVVTIITVFIVLVVVPVSGDVVIIVVIIDQQKLFYFFKAMSRNFDFFDVASFPVRTGPPILKINNY